MRAAVPVVLTAALLLGTQATASADVIFDPADADDLAATLTEATKQQGVCYGWAVNVNDAFAGSSESVGSNLGAGQPVQQSQCPESVVFTASITYTSESSESEDSASYDVQSTSGGPTRTDLDALGLDFGGLTGENPDVVIGKAVAALPLLAADKGMAEPIVAAPATGTAPADAQLTDDPGSDWWRDNGGLVLWGVGLILAAGVFALWIVRSERRRRHNPVRTHRPVAVPDTIPPGFYPADPNPSPAARPAPEPKTTPFVKPDPRALAGQEPKTVAEPRTEPEPVESERGTAAGRSTMDRPADQAPPSGTDTAPPEQKDKE